MLIKKIDQLMLCREAVAVCAENCNGANKCKVSGFCCIVVEAFALLGCYSAYVGVVYRCLRVSSIFRSLCGLLNS
jgi:hypothetical protein